MTRKEVEAQFANDGHRVTTPGKFEGEMLYVPALWEVVLEGFAIDCQKHRNCAVVSVDKMDKKEYPELGKRKTIHLQERDDGFVVERIS